MEEQRVLEAIGLARGANALTRKGAASLLTVLRERFNLAPPRQDQENLFRRYHDQYGGCAIDVGNIDLKTLRSKETKLLNNRAR